MTLRCPLQDQCSGCDLLHLNSNDQKLKKVEAFKSGLGLDDIAIKYQSFGDGALRSRLDFVLSNGKLGLYQKNSREIIDIENCLQLEPALHEFYLQFRQVKWPIKKGSVRLRVGPQQEHGAWLDFANEDIKQLLEAKESLSALQEIAFIEIGQRHKTLIQKPSGALGLGEPILKNWFQTWMRRLRRIKALFALWRKYPRPAKSPICSRILT